MRRVLVDVAVAFLVVAVVDVVAGADGGEGGHFL